MYFSKVAVLSFEIIWKNCGKSLGPMAELASYQSASGLGFSQSTPCFVPSHQILATPLISSVRPLTSFWSFFI